MSATDMQPCVASLHNEGADQTALLCIHAEFLLPSGADPEVLERGFICIKVWWVRVTDLINIS